jgi:hypothetical protein
MNVLGRDELLDPEVLPLEGRIKRRSGLIVSDVEIEDLSVPIGVN